MINKESSLVTKEFLEDIFSSIEGGIVTIDKNGRVTTFNRSAEEITGFKAGEALEKECFHILRHDLCEEKCPIKETLETGKTCFNYEINITNKEGNKVPINLTTSPLRTRDGEIIGIIENFRDLTKHKGLWAKLRQERNRAQQYLNVAAVIIAAINDQGIVTLINKKGCDVLGYKEEEIVGQNWFDLCLPERIKKEVKGIFEKLMAGKNGLVEYYENPILTKSGEERIVAWHNNILKDEKENIIGSLSSGEDITKRKQTEADLIRSEKLASVGQLAASIAHEVNNPLAGILLYMKLLLKKYAGKELQTPETETQLLKMERGLEKTSRIVKNLLDFSRQSEPSIRPVKLNKVVESALFLVRNQINLENIKLEKKLAEQLPPVLADFDQIQQVLINIIMNATQAMPDGGTLEIATSAAKGIKIGESTKDTVRIDIKDTGVGILGENLKKLFTPFFSTKKKGKGVGLGLSVVHGIIEQHKGKIEVDSEPDVGTTFTIYLGVADEKKSGNTGC
jgi:PAS domain S-box-containing protein